MLKTKCCVAKTRPNGIRTSGLTRATAMLAFRRLAFRKNDLIIIQHIPLDDLLVVTIRRLI